MKRLETFFLQVLFGVPALWFARRWAPPDENVSALHQWYARRTRVRLRSKSWWVLPTVVVLWAPVTVLTAFFVLFQHGASAKRISGRGYCAQIRDMAFMAVHRGTPPPWYYVYELYRPELRHRAGRYLMRHEVKPDGIYAALRRYSGAVGNRTLGDKLQFWEFCRDHGLAAATVHAEFVDGAAHWTSTAGFPTADLFAKPRRSRGGRGAERWNFRAADGTWSDLDGRRLDATGLEQHFRDRSREQSYLVQECLVNHDQITSRTLSALSTIRILVCQDENWEPEVVHAYMRMSSDPAKIVDNVHAGGLASPVDIESGVIGAATDLGLSSKVGWVDEHPTTGASITGFTVPLWEEAKDLARRAQRALGVFCVGGWDVAITPEGPVIVEGNHGPCVDSTQKMLRRPIGNTRYGRLLAFHIARAEAGLPPPRRDPARSPTEPALRSDAHV